MTPVGITMTRDGKTAFVALGKANHVAIVNVPKRTVENMVLVGKRAWGLALSRDNSTLYVANGLSDDVSVVDVAKGRGIKVAAAKNFKLSNDPRERHFGNVALLTAGIDADVIWVVDGDGEFAREVPYRTVLPRPVVGNAGLVPEAWHASWERYGAPQLNRRFKKSADRWMTSTDWAAWIATKAIIEVALKEPDARMHRHALRSPDLVLDGFKGARLSFRPWDQQLRQPVFLAHGGIGGGIAGVAPFDGFLHQKNNLDTLGADETESPCKLVDQAAAGRTKK